MAEDAVTPRLAAALKRRRAVLNALVAEATLAHRGLDHARVEAFVRDCVVPTASFLPDGALDAALDAFVGIGVELVARELDGLVVPAWLSVTAAAPALVASAPRRFARCIANAAIGVHREGLTSWHVELARLAGGCATLEELLAVGQVLAWRMGLAHYRASALGVWRGLRPALQRATVGVTAQDATRFDDDPWFDPRSARAIGPQLVARLGGFRGLGGPFIAPPQVTRHGGAIVAYDRESAHVVSADAFGATLRQVALNDALTPGRDKAIALPELARASSVVRTGEMLVAALHASHHVMVVRL